MTLHVPVYCMNHNALETVSTEFQNTQCAHAAVNLTGDFLICCLILKESCSYCNYPDKIQC